MDDLLEKRQEVVRAIIDADRELSGRLIMEWGTKHSFKQAFHELFEPALDEIGKLWHQNKLSLAQGYLAGKVAEDVFLEASKDTEFKKTLENKGNVVIGNIEDDYHSLGRKLLAVFLTAAGWTVHDMGNDVMADEFIAKAMETNSRVIGVSAMMYTTAKNIKKLSEALNKQNLHGKIQLAVGGAVFKLRPQLVGEVGGDGTSANALNAPELFDELWKKSIAYEK